MGLDTRNDSIEIGWLREIYPGWKFGCVEFVPAATDQGRVFVIRLRDDARDLTQQAFITDDQFAEMLLSQAAEDSVTRLATTLCRRAGLRVLKKELGMWRDRWVEV